MLRVYTREKKRKKKRKKMEVGMYLNEAGGELEWSRRSMRIDGYSCLVYFVWICLDLFGVKSSPIYDLLHIYLS